MTTELDRPATSETSPPKAAPRSGRGAWVRAASSVYALLVLAILALIDWVGDGWWGVTVLLFVPRWLYLAPVAALAFASGCYRRPADWAMQGAIGLVVAGPLMGFTLPMERLRPSHPGGERFRVLSYNVCKGPADPDGLIRLVERERIDLIAFQEEPDRGSRLDACLARAGWHRDKGRFLASRFPIVAELPPLEETSRGKWYGARLTRVRVRAPSGAEFVVASVHLPTLRPGLLRLLEGDPPGLESHLAWWRQELDRVVRGLSEVGDTPLLIGGDFNMPPDDASMAGLRSVLRSGFEEAGLGYGYTRPASAPWFRIDHILASPHWTFTRCWVGPDLGSDHLPLIAEAALTVPAPHTPAPRIR